MPEINNALALGVKADQPDFLGTLGKAAQLKQTEAQTNILQQSYGEREREYGENGGLTSGQRSVMSDTHQKAMGAVGNIFANDQSPAARQEVLNVLNRAAIPVNAAMAGHIMTAPPDQIKQYGQNAQRLGMSSTTNVDQSGVPAGNAAREAGRFLPQGIPPNEPITNRTAAATGNIGQSATPATLQAAAGANGVAGAVGRTPGQVVADRTPPADMFTPSIVKGPDGSISSSVTPATTALQGQATKQYEKAGENANNAHALTMSLDMMDHSADVLNSAGWSSTGAGANAKMGAAKSVNSMLQTFGLPPAVDPNKVSNWEDLNKETTRAGFKLASTLGSREAVSIVQSSVGAVPSAENTMMGFKLVSSGIRQAIQREKDFYAFSTDYAKTHRGNTFGADVDFNKQFPPDLYAKTAIANALPPEAIKLMKSDPKLADKFDAKYGKGMSTFILHHDQAQ